MRGSLWYTVRGMPIYSRYVAPGMHRPAGAISRNVAAISTNRDNSTNR